MEMRFLFVLALVVVFFGSYLRAEEQEREEWDVIIIGAGLSGLSAARHLVQNSEGLTIALLEGRDRIGGRTFTDTSLGTPLDIGASWIQGTKNNPIREYADEKGFDYINTDFEDYEVYDLSEGGSIVENANRKNWIEDYNVKYKHRQSIQQSIFEALDVNSEQEITPFMNMSISVTYKDEYAADVSDLDGWADREYDTGDYGSRNVVFPNGYSQIVNAAYSDILDAVESNNHDFNLYLHSRVTQIYEFNDQSVILNDTDDDDGSHSMMISVDYIANYGSENATVKTINAKRVILTVPLGVLKAEKEELIQLDEMSEAQWDAIDSLGFGILSKIYLRMDQVYWPMNTEFFYVISEDGSRDENSAFLMNFFPLIGEPIILAFYGGSRGWKLAEQESEQHKVEQLVRQLDAMFGSEDGSIGMGNVQGWLLSEWNRDEFTGNGTYSFFKLGADQDARSKMCAPVSVGSGQSTLYFAGEHCSLGRSALTDGAWDSGIYVADCIFNNDECKDLASEGYSITHSQFISFHMILTMTFISMF